MERSSPSPHLASPVELKERLESDRAGVPYVVYRDERASQHIVRLSHGGRPVMVGRGKESDICLDWDPRASRLHAELCHVSGHWLVIDDGLSSNGTYLNGERVVGRLRLKDGDQLRIGNTTLLFREPIRRPGKSTVVGSLVEEGRPELSPAQRRVLLALCRPFREGAAFASPATNQQIADELCLSIPAVKTHLRTLFERFGIESLAQNEKRARLVQLSFNSGAVSPAELENAQ